METGKCAVCGKECTIAIEDNIETRVCEHCGFMTMSTFKLKSPLVEQYEKTTAEIVRKLRFVDLELEQYWYPSTLYIQGEGAVFPVGNEKNYRWAYAPVVTVPIHERLQYPIPGKKDEYYEMRLAVEQSKEYKTFQEAVKNLE